MIKYLTIIFFVFQVLLTLAQSSTSSFSTTFSKACVGGSISFVNNSTGSVSSSNWDFGDGVVQSLSGKQNTSHSFSNPGKYEVTLTVISSTGSVTVSSKVIEIIALPNLNFTIDGNKCEIPAGLTFINNSVNSDGLTYAWNFGNGQSSTIFNPGVINYSSSGKFNISLSLTSSLPGCVASPITKTIQTYDFKATISGKDLFCAKSGTSLIAKASLPVDSYVWNYGDGTFGENNDTVSPEFKKAGSFVVDLKIINNSIQCESHAFYKVTAKPISSPVFSVNTTKICPGYSVIFSNSTISMTDFIWDFGDGTSYSGKDPGSHVYKNEGKMTVTLTAKSSNGCYGSITQNGLIEVFNPIPIIESDTSNGCSILPVQFKDLSTSNDEVNNPITSWSWDFGNGITFNGKNPSKQNFDVGKYDVKLKIVTSQGCVVEKIFKEFIKVGKIDKVDFKSVSSNGCVNSPINFYDNSSVLSPHDESELTYDWKFSDTTSNTGKSIFQKFNKDTGMVSIKFYIHFRGCTDSIVKGDFLRVKPPLAKFTPDTTLFCFDKDVLPYPIINSFTDISKLGKNGDSIDVNWNYGDNQNQLIQNVDPTSITKSSSTHTFQNFGTYKVLQTVINHTTECQDTTSRLFHISWVKPNFEISVDSVCQNSTLQFIDKSSSFSQHPLATYSYSTGEGTTVSGQLVKYAYTNYGKMYVNNHPINKVGCSSTIKDFVEVIKLPNADIVSDVDSSCAPGSILFSNHSKISGNSMPYKMFYWNIPDKNIADSTSIISHEKSISYTKVGRYYATLKAKDIFGCVSKIDTVWVVLSKPESAIDYKSVVCNNNDFKIYNKTKNWVNNSWMIDGNFIGKDKDSIIYQFNDNKNLGISKSHVLTLISLDKKKCIDTLEKIITVSMPKIGYSVSFKSLLDTSSQYLEFKCPPLTSFYINTTQSIGSIDSSFWIFSKNSKSYLDNPLKIYTKPGLYSTYLQTVDEFGCKTDTTVKDFLKINGPIGYPTWKGMGDVCGQFYQFDLKNIDKVSKIEWNMDDGTLYNDSITLKHRYPEITIYKPTVTLTDFENCKVTYLMEEPDTLIKIPDTGMDAKFDVSSYEVKLGESLYLSEHSISPNQPIVQWKWNYNYPATNFIDSFTFSSPHSIKYSYYGTKNILLTVIDKDLCSDQQLIKINVLKDYDMPNVFTPNSDGKNDNFELFDTIFKTYNFYVFNRWGNKVYELNQGKGVYLWDGTNKSKTPVENGEYFYYLIGEFDDGTLLKKNGGVAVIKD
jgi:gliding motility-associated-like protein